MENDSENKQLLTVSEGESHRPEIYEKLSALFENKQTKVRFTKKNGEKCVERIGKTAYGDFIIMKKGSTRRGQLIDYDEYTDVVGLQKLPVKSVWNKQLTRAITMLEKSGLWTKMKDDMKIALQVGYDNINSILDKKYENTLEMPTDEVRKQEIERARAIDPRLVVIGEDGNEHVSDIVYEYSEPLKIKAMNFGYDNERKIGILKEAMAKKVAISLKGRTSYDVSLSYDPVKNEAIYAEEFKNCGNGYYYLALSATHAMFYEYD